MPDNSFITGGTNGDSGATATENVVPLDYTQLRLLAECAAGSTGTVEFISRRGTTLEQFSQEGRARLEAYDVLIPTSNAGARRPANRVMLKPFGNPQSRMESERPMGIADAVFWSDAAVQKFVFPYVASCAGTTAASVLQQLQNAWNYFPVNQVSVLALVHVTSFEPNTPLSLEQAFWVAFTEPSSGGEAPEMQTMPLNEFLTRFVPSNPAPPPLKWTRYHRGVDERQSKFPEYASLRAMAEWACSIRGEPKYFICKKGETTFGPPQEKFPEVGPEDIVVPVLTPTVPDGRQPLGGVWVQAEGAAEFMNLAWTGDAMFWSTGAVEQFLCPYYASKVGLEAMNTVATLADYWLGTRQIPTAGADETVAGLIHLYTSEWVIETSTGAIIDEPLTDTTSTLGLEAVSPTQQLGALTVDIAGNTYLRRLVG